MKEKFQEKNLGTPLGYLFSIYAIISVFSYPFILWNFKHLGIAIGLILSASAYVLDYLTSNATEFNMSIMRKNGYDPEKFLKGAILNYYVTFIIDGLIHNHIFQYAETHFDFKLVINVLVIMGLTEVYFITVHKLMHRYYPNLHKLHHCCLRPSYTTNMFFDNLDSFLEATFPIIIADLFTIFYSKDYFALIVVYAIISTWYSMDHDEYLKPPHWYHHKFINSNYGVYIKGGSFDDKDEIKKAIVR